MPSGGWMKRRSQDAVTGGLWVGRLTRLKRKGLALGAVGLLLVLGGCGTFVPDEDPPVGIFPDPNLEKAVRDALDKPIGDITMEDMASLNVLEAEFSDIEDLTGLQFAVNLERLNLGYNALSELGPLEELTDLTVLLLWGNEIEDVGPLATLTSLEELALSYNDRISDIEPLQNLTQLEALRLRRNVIDDVSPLVANSDAGGLGDGDYVDLRDNNLDLDAGSEDREDIQSLLDRGVDVDY